MQQGIPVVTGQQIFDKAIKYFGGGSMFQTTAYDTFLIITDSETYDIFHHFELFDRKILWINQAQQELRGEEMAMMPRTIFPYSESDFDGHIVAHRFASVLCYATHATFIDPRVWGGSRLPAATISQPAEKYTSMLYSHDQIDNAIQRINLEAFTEKRWAALAHYRQATLASTPYYKVLSYWKILELYFNNVRTDINSYIDGLYASNPDIFHYVGNFLGAASKRLRDIRNTSAHFMLEGDTEIQDPDNPDIFNEVDKGIFVLHRVTEGLIDGATGW